MLSSRRLWRRRDARWWSGWDQDPGHLAETGACRWGFKIQYCTPAGRRLLRCLRVFICWTCGCCGVGCCCCINGCWILAFVCSISSCICCCGACRRGRVGCCCCCCAVGAGGAASAGGSASSGGAASAGGGPNAVLRANADHRRRTAHAQARTRRGVARSRRELRRREDAVARDRTEQKPPTDAALDGRRRRELQRRPGAAAARQTQGWSLREGLAGQRPRVRRQRLEARRYR